MARSLNQQQARTGLALLLADALLTEAREIEEAAWSPGGSGDHEPPVEATRRRMQAEFTYTRARRAHEQEGTTMIVGRYRGDEARPADTWTATARMIGAFVPDAAQRVEWLAGLSWIARLPETA